MSKVLLIHKLPASEPYEDVSWYGWFEPAEYFDDNMADFHGKTRKEALDNAASQIEHWDKYEEQPDMFEAYVVDLIAARHPLLRGLQDFGYDKGC